MHPFACGNPNRQILGHQAKEHRPAWQFLEKTLMRKIIAGALFMALAGALTVAAPQRDRDDRHDNGKHKGQEKHEDRDRKSTRLNSSHVAISYAVFCLKKKKKNKDNKSKQMNTN